jgi:hypothetical protein
MKIIPEGRNINGDLDDGNCSVFLMPPRDIAEGGSSIVKGLIEPKGWGRILLWVAAINSTGRARTFRFAIMLPATPG